MNLGLTDKVAVIMGASKGIGFAVAKEFLKEGCKVAITARHENELVLAAKELSEYGEVYYEALDATKDDMVYSFAKHVYEKFGYIHSWINNVGATGTKAGEEYTDQEINYVTDICFKSAVYGCQAAFRYMKNQGGSIVNISSLAARCPSAGRSTLYGPMKAAIVNLTNTMAGEYCAYGVRVVCVMPGFTLTPLARENISQEELDFNKNGTLLRKLAEPEDIAKPVVFLASDAASYITATTLEVSGGRSVTLNPSYSYDKKQNLS
ncbi:MAG: 17-beta-hydroxysteroid dehydrogenase [Lachnospiraceae bacterium]|jgi:NAD(P)-dependent dehydrogenase (short-subunit alcohol dehydrogenase family)|nr:17-beta-hydroxysteroid dehydrogenase [Lachnospiraceae bacterium]